MVELKNKQNLSESKIRTTVYLERGLLEYARNAGLNVSQIANKALNSVKVGLNGTLDVNEVQITVISSKEYQNKSRRSDYTQDVYKLPCKSTLGRKN